MNRTDSSVDEVFGHVLGKEGNLAEQITELKSFIAKMMSKEKI